MARKNLGRTVGTNKTLAERIQYERERRDWTMEALARHMEEVGCKIHHTAVYKIERGNPRRTVSFEEAAAFAKVFDLTLDELAVPPLIARSQEARALLNELYAATKAGQETAARITKATDRLGELLRGTPELVPEIRTVLEPATWTHGDSLLINLGALTLDETGEVVPVVQGQPVNAATETTKTTRAARAKGEK